MTDSPKRIPCNQCGSYTWHDALFETKSEFPLFDSTTGEAFDAVEEHWHLYRCRGCDSITLFMIEDAPWNCGEVVHYFPERSGSNHHKKYYQKLPKRLERLYDEVVVTYNHEALILCAAGLRALIEGVCQDQCIVEGPSEHRQVSKTLEGRINGLASVVPAGIVNNLHGYRFLGNRALHELDAPTKDELVLALQVIEDILNVIYDLDYRARCFHEAIAKKRNADKAE